MNSYGSSYAAPIDSAERDRVSCCALQPTHNAAAAPGLACFCPPSTPFFADRTGTFDEFPLSLPMAAGLPSFVRIGRRLLSMLRLGRARVAHFVLRDLGSRKSQISCRIATISVPIATCSGSSALPTRLDRPSEFHGHRALFTDLAPARRGVISVFHVACSARPCGPAPTAAAARNFNTEFSPATFSGQPRSCRLVGRSESQFGSDRISRRLLF